MEALKLDMYLKHFGFQQPPFAINPDPRFLYLSPRHQEALAHLLYGLGEGGGFVMLSGEVGTGKTTLCFTLLEHLGDNVDVALILNSRLNSLELLAALCDELHIPYPRESDSRKVLIDRLNQFLLANHARGRRTVAVIDEAQNLSIDVMEQIRLLTNLETPTTKLLQIVLVGQPELPHLLARPDLRQVNQRITARYHLGSLDAADTRQYIRHRLSVAGGSPTVFSASALRAVFRLSKGIPRLINVICDRALLGGFTLDRTKIDRRIVEKAYREAYARNRPNLWISALAASLFLGLAVTSVHTLDRSHRLVTSRPAISADGGAERELSGEVQPPLRNAEAKAEPTAALVTTPAAAVRPPSSPVFSVWVDDPARSEPMALGRLVHRWRPDWPLQPISCDRIRSLGLRCLRQRGAWEDLRRQNLPGILTIRGAGDGERAVLLLDANETEAEFLDHDGKTIKFPTIELLSRWAGESLVVWEPPSNRALLVPGMVDPAILWLRQRLTAAGYGAAPSGSPQSFDEPLKSALMRFQGNWGIQVDGVAGEKTLAALSGIRSSLDVPFISHNATP